jgi:hypothetical protein
MGPTAASSACITESVTTSASEIIGAIPTLGRHGIRQEIIARVAALDIGKAELVCCVRVPDPKGGSRRVQEVKSYSTMTRSLQVMADRLMDLGVTRIVMEATSDYWDSRELHQTGAGIALFPQLAA